MNSSIRLLTGLALISLASLSSCDELGCTKCQNALDHMQSKIDQFGCNPSFMQEAQDRIAEDCTDHEPTQRFIESIVENCYAGEGWTSCITPEAFTALMQFENGTAGDPLSETGAVFFIGDEKLADLDPGVNSDLMTWATANGELTPLRIEDPFGYVLAEETVKLFRRTVSEASSFPRKVRLVGDGSGGFDIAYIGW